MWDAPSKTEEKHTHNMNDQKEEEEEDYIKEDL